MIPGVEVHTVRLERKIFENIFENINVYHNVITNKIGCALKLIV